MSDQITRAETTILPPGANDPIRDFEGLDREHLARVLSPSRCDTARASQRDAMDQSAGLDEEADAVRASRKALGSDEHLAAIRDSEWFPYGPALKRGGRLAWIVDSVLWFALTLSGALAVLPALGDPSVLRYIVAGILAVGLAVTLAKGARGVGRHFAVTRLTDPASVNRTIHRHVRLSGKLGAIAFVCVLALVALYFLASGEFAAWAQSIGGGVTLVANVMLGLSAGILLSASDLLEKVARADSLDRLLEMKARAKRYLGRYLLVAAMLLLPGAQLVPGYAAARPVWTVAIDVTDSMDPVQRDVAIGAFVETALARARALRVEWIAVIPFSDQEVLSDLAAVRVPAVRAPADCASVSPPIRLTKSWVALSPGALRAAKAEAVASCESDTAELRRADAADEARFVAELRRATRVLPRADVTTRIVPLVQSIADRPYVRAIDVVTDLLDRSRLPVESLHLPRDTPVTVIVTRPNPLRPEFRLSETLQAAERWGRVPGIRVCAASEYALLARAAKEE